MKKFFKDFKNHEPIVKYNVLNVNPFIDLFLIILFWSIFSIIALIVELIYLILKLK